MFSRFVRTWCISLALGASAALPAGAQTDSFPAKPVSIVVPATPGGTSDLLARLLAKKLAQAWGQSVVVENKPGAGSIIGSTYVANAKPDGHTLMLTFSELASLPSINKNTNLDVVKQFSRLGKIGSLRVIVLGRPNLEASNMSELLALLRANPGKYTYSSNGPGSTLQLYAELFKREAQVDVMHVPYRGSAEASMALMSGEVDLLVQFASGNVASYVRDGKARAYAIASQARLPSLPRVPTTAEAGLPGFQLDAWYGLFAPAGVPDSVIAKINRDLNKALSDPDVKDRLVDINMQVQTGTPAEFDAFFKKEHKRWAELIQATGIQSN